MGAALISVPLRSSYDRDIGPMDHGDRWLLYGQPVIPSSLNEGWNLISRSILPVVRQSDSFPGVSKLTQLGNQLVSLGGSVWHWLDSPDSGAEGFQARIIVTLLFPR